MNESRTHESRVRIAPGARAVEALLLEEIAPLLAAARADCRLLAKPIRIVVPSHGLRDHVGATLVRHFGGALAGVQIQTLVGLARELLERTHTRTSNGEELVPILIRAAAMHEPLLSGELGALRDGFGAVVGSVRDLLDAGLGTEHTDAAAEALASAAAGATERARAAALVRVGAAVSRRLETLGIDSRASVLRRAREALERDPEHALPQRAVFVHGFADATGVATDLIEALVARCDARVLLDHPPDPADPERSDPGCAFTARFAGRLGRFGLRHASAAAIAPPIFTLLEAPGAEAELRGVAVRVRALLDEGVLPERIAVVARTLGPLAARIRTHFDRLGVPFSTRGSRGGLDGVGRRIRALLELLERRGETPADRWLDLVPLRGRVATEPADLRLALHALGAARLAHVASLDLSTRLDGADSLPLPVRRGIDVAPEEGGGSARVVRRHVSRHALTETITAAARTCAALAGWPDEATIGEHLARLRELAANVLGWSEEEPARAPFVEKLDLLVHDLPQDVRIASSELLLLLRSTFADLGAPPIGGAGAGVQVLDAMGARGRTFAHLFLIGLNRDVFPRIVLEDALLPDALRRALAEGGAGVVPDLPRKQDGFDEERYLFAQLLSSSPRVTLSWQFLDDDGKERAVSTLVERLRLEGRAGAAVKLPALWRETESAAPRPAAEHAVLAGLHGSRVALAKILPLAVGEAMADSLREGAAATSGEPAAVAPDRTVAIAHARMGMLDALEPVGRARDSLGPLFGFVGARRPGDERDGPLAVTTLETIAGCPWQAFLSRVLHVEPAPDALEALPCVDALLLGTVLHAAIEAIVKAVIPGERESIEAARVRGALRVSRPSDTDLRRLLRHTARSVLARDGLVLEGLADVLAGRAEPLVREVLAHVWTGTDGAATLLGAELAGNLLLHDDDGRPREIGFRADLVEATPGGERLIDLKSGKPISTHTKPKTRRDYLHEAIANGTKLQAFTYARAVHGEGVYLFADPERAKGQPICSVSHDDPELLAAFEPAVRTLLASWDRGSFLPRLEMAEGARSPSPCTWCSVSEACVRGDSGARIRMRRWIGAPDTAAGPEAAALLAARNVFQLPGRKPEPDDEVTS